MADHYYSSAPTSESRPQRVRVSARGVSAELWTDAGVFAKRGLDFGTRVLVEQVQLPEGALAVDLGCGYGAVTALLARVYPDSRWLLIDVNERAVALAQRNVEALGERARVVLSDGFSAVADMSVDAVILNPPIRAGKAVVYRLFDEAHSHLRPDGCLWVVIHKKHGAESARDRLSQTFGVVERVAREAGYHVYRCVRQ